MKKTILFSLIIIFLTGTVLAFPPTPSAFYGKAQYEDGTPIPDGYNVSAKLNDNELVSCVVIDGTYGYGSNSLIVLAYDQIGGTIKFYINGEKTNEEAEFIDMGVTNLDLTANAPPVDSSVPDDGGDDGGGGGGGGSPIPSLLTNDTDTDTTTTNNDLTSGQDGGDENEETGLGILETTPQPSTFSKITGAVTGALGRTSGMIIIIFIIILIALTITTNMLRKKTR